MARYRRRDRPGLHQFVRPSLKAVFVDVHEPPVEKGRLLTGMDLPRYAMIEKRAAKNAAVRRIRTMPKPGSYTALALVAHIGSIDRFPHARSLSNYFGIAPGCRNSGDTDRRGSKVGRVAVMRRTCESIWHMLSKKEDYLSVDDRGAGNGKKSCRPAA